LTRRARARWGRRSGLTIVRRSLERLAFGLKHTVIASDSEAIQTRGRRKPQVWIASLCSR
jgi:hypothetical protein